MLNNQTKCVIHEIKPDKGFDIVSGIKLIPLFWYSRAHLFIASHADVLRGSSRVPATDEPHERPPGRLIYLVYLRAGSLEPLTLSPRWIIPPIDMVISLCPFLLFL